MNKTCLDCKSAIKGRADKKFCDDQCRSNYNNKIKTDHPTQIKTINTILLKNRKVLEKLNPDGKTKVSGVKFTQLSFNFKYFTHTYTNQKGDVYKFCYEFGYLKLEHDYYLLVKEKSALES
ncbi:hypothetical protein [Pedobacter cryophilus]|uniref:DUF2116 family Zn-ribbon domain-containing protein n=1 Tax=Pedobacter cryophilus TaxID=2571271 RepID=A0A4U1BWF3_9SPHI|nr:hypothetical protein [Pedobacter cryophilus]TKB96822.1 hypothetical protein FA046_12115 [Pedobacter cryophilus]